jgi:hypothetical protein
MDLRRLPGTPFGRSRLPLEFDDLMLPWVEVSEGFSEPPIAESRTYQGPAALISRPLTTTCLTRGSLFFEKTSATESTESQDGNLSRQAKKLNKEIDEIEKDGKRLIEEGRKSVERGQRILQDVEKMRETATIMLAGSGREIEDEKPQTDSLD